MKRILITGCGGMLGKAFYEVFKKEFKVKATDIDLNEKWLSHLDARDYKEAKKVVKQFKPDYIFHLAALTDLEYCENKINESYITNTLGTENMAILAKELDVPLIYISTAGIFDGAKDIYDDYDVPNPLSHYGRSKYMGELFVEKNLSKYFVFRAGWMMGGGKKDKKFIAKIINQIIDGKKTLHVIDDLYGTPTYTYDFANNALVMIKTNFYGIYNMVCGGNASRYDVAKELVKDLGLEKKIVIKKVTTKEFNEKNKEYFAPRPDSERLIDRKLTIRGLNKMRDWKVCLKEYINKEWKDKI